MRKPFLILTAVITCLYSCDSSTPHEKNGEKKEEHWSYKGETGPEH